MPSMIQKCVMVKQTYDLPIQAVERVSRVAGVNLPIVGHMIGQGTQAAQQQYTISMPRSVP
jgi:hypothetical protein